jgi:hypothetical protein
MPMQLALGSHQMVYTCYSAHGVKVSASRVLLVKASSQRLLVLHDAADSTSDGQAGINSGGVAGTKRKEKRGRRWSW